MVPDWFASFAVIIQRNHIRNARCQESTKYTTREGYLKNIMKPSPRFQRTISNLVPRVLYG